ncbi:UDP binding domain-containing protein [Halomonas sp. HK25]|uniref:UDP binding domain-containing protein n=1 Tax=Halomonas sp. HK25 TaxID=3394321 RepID=UPI0039FD7F4B
MILFGRRINDAMGAYVVSQLVKEMVKRRIHVRGARVLVMGMTFKENCPDLHNTLVVDILAELADYSVMVDVLDPQASKEATEQQYGILLIQNPEVGIYDAILLAVAYREFHQLGAASIHRWRKSEHVIYDLKYVLPRASVDIRL